MMNSKLTYPLLKIEVVEGSEGRRTRACFEFQDGSRSDMFDCKYMARLEVLEIRMTIITRASIDEIRLMEVSIDLSDLPDFSDGAEQYWNSTLALRVEYAKRIEKDT